MKLAGIKWLNNSMFNRMFDEVKHFNEIANLKNV